MQFFNISLVTVMVRFYAMMAAVIIGIFFGQGWLAFLALPIFLSIMLGISFKKEEATKSAKIQKRTASTRKAA